MSEVCTVCLEPVDQHAATLPCGHCFHSSCLINVFRRFETCPVCRQRVDGVTDVPNTAARMIMDVVEELQNSDREMMQRQVSIRRRSPRLADLYQRSREKNRELRQAERALNDARSALWRRIQGDTNIAELERLVKNAKARATRAERSYARELDLAMQGDDL